VWHGLTGQNSVLLLTTRRANKAAKYVSAKTWTKTGKVRDGGGAVNWCQWCVEILLKTSSWRWMFPVPVQHAIVCRLIWWLDNFAPCQSTICQQYHWQTRSRPLATCHYSKNCFANRVALLQFFSGVQLVTLPLMLLRTFYPNFARFNTLHKDCTFANRKL